jgi:hypothetical protein
MAPKKKNKKTNKAGKLSAARLLVCFQFLTRSLPLCCLGSRRFERVRRRRYNVALSLLAV